MSEKAPGIKVGEFYGTYGDRAEELLFGVLLEMNQAGAGSAEFLQLAGIVAATMGADGHAAEALTTEVAELELGEVVGFARMGQLLEQANVKPDEWLMVTEIAALIQDMYPDLGVLHDSLEVARYLLGMRGEMDSEALGWNFKGEGEAMAFSSSWVEALLDELEGELGLDQQSVRVLPDVDEPVVEVEDGGNSAVPTAESLYFRDSNHSLLTVSEEVEAARVIDGGKRAFLRLLMSNDLDIQDVLLTGSWESGIGEWGRINWQELMVKAEAALKPGFESSTRGDWQAVVDAYWARNKLVTHNTRFVVSLAKRYMGQGLPFLDLIQEGNIGLMCGVDRYDVSKGFRLSTYVGWWIRQAITRSLADKSRTIRVPVHATEGVRELYKTWQRLRRENGKAPTAEELAQALGWKKWKVKTLLQMSQDPLSLDKPVNDEEGASEFGELVEDREAVSPQAAAENARLREVIDEVLGEFTPKEQRIIRLRFGLIDGQKWTLEEVGQKFGLTRERIRQIEGKVLRSLRHPRRTRKLRGFYDTGGEEYKRGR